MTDIDGSSRDSSNSHSWDTDLGVSPQDEALGALRNFLIEEGFETRIPLPSSHGDGGGRMFRSKYFEVIIKDVWFEVGLIGAGVRLSQHERGRNGHFASVFFDLNDPKCFDQLLTALRGGYESWLKEAVRNTIKVNGQFSFKNCR